MLKISQSRIGFVIERSSSGEHSHFNMQACIDSSATQAATGLAAPALFTRLDIQDHSCQKLGVALNGAFIKHSPRLYQAEDILAMSLEDLPFDLDQMIVIPLISRQKVFAVLGLANAEEPYREDFVKRVWPLMTTSICVLRTMQVKTRDGMVSLSSASRPYILYLIHI